MSVRRVRRVATTGLSAVALLFAAAPGSHAGPVVAEARDAGDLPATAHATHGTGSLTAVSGTIADPNDVDMWELCLTGEPFTAATEPASGRIADPQLFLFDADGIGRHVDDDSGPGTNSLLQVPAPAAGRWYLAISDFNNDPVSSGGPIFGRFAADGPGAAHPIADWNDFGGSVGGGDYVVSLAGVAACPAPDGVPPVVTVVSPTPDGRYLVGSTVVADYTCADEAGGSGLASCVGDQPSGTTLDTSQAGPRRFTVRASDLAGNATVATVDYAVVYGFSGFGAPVSGGGSTPRRAGATLPLTWRLTDASGNVVDDPATFAGVTSVPCGAAGPEVREPSTGGSGLQRQSDGSFQWNWKTDRAYAGTCREVRLHLSDGAVHTAEVRFA